LDKSDSLLFFEVAGDAALPVEIGEVRRFATGDARGLEDLSIHRWPSTSHDYRQMTGNRSASTPTRH
jgi:hypothetical protein